MKKDCLTSLIPLPSIEKYPKINSLLDEEDSKLEEIINANQNSILNFLNENSYDSIDRLQLYLGEKLGENSSSEDSDPTIGLSMHKHNAKMQEFLIHGMADSDDEYKQITHKKIKEADSCIQLWTKQMLMHVNHMRIHNIGFPNTQQQIKIRTILQNNKIYFLKCILTATKKFIVVFEL